MKRAFLVLCCLCAGAAAGCDSADSGDVVPTSFGDIVLFQPSFSLCLEKLAGCSLGTHSSHRCRSADLARSDNTCAPAGVSDLPVGGLDQHSPLLPSITGLWHQWPCPSRSPGFSLWLEFHRLAHEKWSPFLVRRCSHGRAGNAFLPSFANRPPFVHPIHRRGQWPERDIHRPVR